MWDEDFLSNFQHAFLIRDPALTLTSIYNKWPDFHEGEVGFVEQRALFDLLHALPFIESALSWEPGADTSTYSWWDGESFHESLKRSTGLVAQPRKYVEISAAPDRVRQVHHR